MPISISDILKAGNKTDLEIQAMQDEIDRLAVVRNLTRKPAKSLMRMLGPKGNPRACNLFEIIAHLQKTAGLRLRLNLIRVPEKKAS